MSAVQIPEEFNMGVCYVTLALTTLARMPTSLYIHNASANVMQLSKLLLSHYQFSSVRIQIEYVVVLRGVRSAVL